MGNINDFMDNSSRWIVDLGNDLRNRGLIPASVDIDKIEITALCHNIDNPNLKTQVKFSLDKEDKKCP